MTESQQPTQRQSIPLAVDADFKLQPVRVGFPDQTADQQTNIGTPALISFVPDNPVIPEPQANSIFESPPFKGVTHISLTTSSGALLLGVIVIAIAAVLIAFLRRRK